MPTINTAIVEKIKKLNGRAYTEGKEFGNSVSLNAQVGSGASKPLMLGVTK